MKYSRRNYVIIGLGSFIIFAIFYIHNSYISYNFHLIPKGNVSISKEISTSLPKEDYRKIIDIEFNFSILNYGCQHKTPLMLILVSSSITNFSKRKIIRETWGSTQDDIIILFLLGTSPSEDLLEQIFKENILHSDIVQGDFIDVYRNLTYKHMMAFKYFLYNCPNVKYMLKIDDDVVINIPELKLFLFNELSPYGTERLLMCNTVRKARPYRSYNSKWRVSFEEYPYRYYPDYCYGWFILYSPDVVYDLYKETQNNKYFWIDDVYITGIIAQKINIVHSDIKHWTLWNWLFLRYRKSFLVAGPDLTVAEMKSLWDYISESNK